jgi:hypothetical protein
VKQEDENLTKILPRPITRTLKQDSIQTIKIIEQLHHGTTKIEILAYKNKKIPSIG